MKKPVCLISIILLLALSSLSAYAQEEDRDAGKLHFTIAPYLWIVNIDATNTVGYVSLPVEVSFGDLFKAMKFGGQAHVELKQNKWGAILDMTYMNIGEDDMAFQLLPEIPSLEAFANYRFKVWMFELGGTYRLAGSMDNALEILLGARWMRSKLDLDVTLGPLELSGGYDEDWIDPIIGARYYAALGSKWFTSLRGDIGGFSVGSKFSYHITGLLGFRISRVIDIGLGYRHMDIDYSNEKEGRELFKFDGYQTGFLVGLNFRL